MPGVAASASVTAVCVLVLTGSPCYPQSVPPQSAREQAAAARQLAQDKKPDEARARYRAAAELARQQGDLALLASILTSLAAIANTPPAESVDLSRQVWDIARQLGDPDLEARALHFWGDYLFTAGDYAAAMEKLQAAATLTEQRKDDESLARIYTSLGRLNRMHGQAEAAIALYQKALAIQERTSDTTGMIQSLNATAIAVAMLREDQRANKYYERAYALALQSKDADLIDFMRGNLAGGLLNTGDYARASELLEQVLAAGAGVYTGVRHGQLARAYLELGRLDEALVHADKAVELTANQPTQRPNALVRRSYVRERRGDLEAALADANAAIAVIEAMRLKLVPADFMKQRYSDYYEPAYTQLIALHQRTGHPEKALEAAELARSRAFLDLLAARDLASVDDARRATARPLAIDEVRATARQSNSTILSYWLGEQKVFVWAVSPNGTVEMKRVAATRAVIASLVDATTSRDAVRGAAATVTRGEKPRVMKAVITQNPWRDLYDLLVAPIAGRLPGRGAHITVVPHDALQRLSFAALQNARGRYMVEDYALNYTPAVAVLGMTAGNASTAQRSYLFVADPSLAPATAGEKRLAALPGARTEVRRIARLVPAQQTTVLFGTKADKDTVVRELGRSTVVHFATHGVTRDSEPLDSYLALGVGPAGDGNGRLTATDLYALRLHADLVVLASCESGGGKPSGDGLSALARGFLFAGARSVVASLWDVPDDAASRFMPLFYASWLRGKSRADALRSAQLQLLAQLRHGRVKVKTPAGEFALPEHPSLWAGFVLLGHS